MDNAGNEVLRSIAQSLATLQQIISADLSHRPSLPFTRPLQRKLESLIKWNVHDAQDPSVAMRLALSVAERAVSDLTVHLQTQQHEKIKLWTAIRSHGCQFLGPAVQEEVLRLILLALEDGSSLSRKALVPFVVQRLQLQFPQQASKTSVGHVVQLLYRASCFNVIKRDEESSLMQLKEEFRNYDALRGQHDMQIVEISRDFGLRFGPELWSSLLYGDSSHRSHMQSIIDKVQKKQTLLLSTKDLMSILQKSGDPLDLSVELQPLLDLLLDLQMNTSGPQSGTVSWTHLDRCLKAVVKVIGALSRSLQLKPMQRTDPSPTLSNRQSETGLQGNVEIEAVAGSSINSYSSPKSCQSELCDGNRRMSSQTIQPSSPFPDDSPDEVLDVTTAMSSCGLSCMEVQGSPSSVITEDGCFRFLSPGYPRGVVAPSPHMGYSLHESLPFHTSSPPPFFVPPINVVTNERVCAPRTDGFCPSPVLVSVHNLPGRSEFFPRVWYPSADDYNQCSVLLNAPSTSNHVSN